MPASKSSPCINDERATPNRPRTPPSRPRTPAEETQDELTKLQMQRANSVSEIAAEFNRQAAKAAMKPRVHSQGSRRRKKKPCCYPVLGPWEKVAPTAAKDDPYWVGRRANYLAMDRPEVAFAATLCCRHLTNAGDLDLKVWVRVV